MSRATANHYFDGEWVPESRLVIPVGDLSVARGFGVFGSLRTYGGQPFRLDEHVARFFRSAALLGLSVPVSPEQLGAIVREGLARNTEGEHVVRLTLTGGESGDFMTPGKPSLIVGFYPLHAPPAGQYARGVKVVTAPHRRELHEAKSLNYAAAVIARREAKAQGAVEAIYVDPVTTEIYEGTTSNVFAVLGGEALTPGQGVLKGVTRQIVLELCERTKIPCRETRLSVADLKNYDELFITSSSREVLPVIQVDGQKIGEGIVGPVSRRLKREFEDYVRL